MAGPAADNSNLRAQLADAVAIHMANVANLPEWAQPHALGRDMTALAVVAVDALFSVVVAFGDARYQEGIDQTLDSLVMCVEEDSWNPALFPSVFDTVRKIVAARAARGEG